MTFSRETWCHASEVCADAIVAKGTIDADTPDAFVHFWQQNPQKRELILDSKGGNLVAGLKLGMQIRRLQLNTRIDSDCFSACAYAFLGGVNRTLGAGGRIGVHQFRAAAGASEPDMATTQKITAVLGRYLDQMGVDRRFLDAASVTPANKVGIFSVAQLKALRVINNPQPPTPRKPD